MNPPVSRVRYDTARAEIETLRRRVTATEQRHDEAEEERRRLAAEVDRLSKATTISGPAKVSERESQLRAELHRRTKAYAALEARLLDVQKVNEYQARQLHDRARTAGGAA